jgi:hypothetical protein
VRGEVLEHYSFAPRPAKRIKPLAWKAYGLSQGRWILDSVKTR